MIGRSAPVAAATLVSASTHAADPEFNWTRIGARALIGTMAKQDETQKLAWPWWASWALLGVAATSLLTIAATLNDIL